MLHGRADDPGTHKRETPKVRYTTLVAQRLVGLRRKFRKAVDSTSRIAIDKTALKVIQTDAVELGKSFDTYPELVLPIVHYSDATAPSSLLNDVFNSFPILQDAIAWNHFWYLRLRVCRLQLDCWNLLETNISSEQQEMESELISRITECADQICNTVPFLVGEVDEQGMYQSQSLPHLRGGFYGCMSGMAGLNSIISTSELDRTRPCMRAWAFSQLDQVGNRVGLKQMSEFARFYQAAFGRTRVFGTWSSRAWTSLQSEFLRLWASGWCSCDEMKQDREARHGVIVFWIGRDLVT